MQLDHIDQLAAGALEGYLVRKDLVRRFSKQFPVPTYVVEFLLGRYCATTDENEIAEGLELVSLIAPTSAERIGMIAREAAGFVYCVSSLGVTGVRGEITTDIGAMVSLVRAANPKVPVAVGFGISTPEQAATMAALSDGAITGSAIIKIIARHGADCVEPVRAYVREMAAAVHAV